MISERKEIPFLNKKGFRKTFKSPNKDKISFSCLLDHLRWLQFCSFIQTVKTFTATQNNSIIQ